MASLLLIEQPQASCLEELHLYFKSSFALIKIRLTPSSPFYSFSALHLTLNFKYLLAHVVQVSHPGALVHIWIGRTVDHLHYLSRTELQGWCGLDGEQQFLIIFL